METDNELDESHIHEVRFSIRYWKNWEMGSDETS